MLVPLLTIVGSQLLGLLLARPLLLRFLGIRRLINAQEEQVRVLTAIHRLMDYELRNRRGVQKVA